MSDEDYKQCNTCNGTGWVVREARCESEKGIKEMPCPECHSMYRELIDFANAEMSKAIIGQTLTTEKIRKTHYNHCKRLIPLLRKNIKELQERLSIYTAYVEEYESGDTT